MVDIENSLYREECISHTEGVWSLPQAIITILNSHKIIIFNMICKGLSKHDESFFLFNNL